MKKYPILLTGIVFLIAILIAGSCKQALSENVDIYCKAVKINGKMHFEMWDSNDPKKVVAEHTKNKIIANHTTDVWPNTQVTWLWAEDSDVDKFVKIKPKKEGKIFKQKPQNDNGDKKVKLKVPPEAEVPSDPEKYDIIFLWEGDTVVIDPYLRIP